jgi:flagellar biosynthesis GTPase FlhF
VSNAGGRCGACAAFAVTAGAVALMGREQVKVIESYKPNGFGRDLLTFAVNAREATAREATAREAAQVAAVKREKKRKRREANKRLAGTGARLRAAEKANKREAREARREANREARSRSALKREAAARVAAASVQVAPVVASAPDRRPWGVFFSRSRVATARRFVPAGVVALALDDAAKVDLEETNVSLRVRLENLHTRGVYGLTRACAEEIAANMTRKRRRA